MVKFLIIIGVLIALYVPIYKLLKWVFTKAQVELTGKTCEDYLSSLTEASRKLTNAVKQEEKHIKQRENALKKIKGDLK